MTEEPDGFRSRDDLLCMFCPECATLMMLAEAEAGRCCQTPERPQCPYRPGEARRKPPETAGNSVTQCARKYPPIRG